MKKILSLLLLIPLTTIAAEHGGKPMQKKVQTQQASEHGGKAMEKKELAGKADEHAGTAAEGGGQPSKEKASENAGTPVE